MIPFAASVAGKVKNYSSKGTGVIQKNALWKENHTHREYMDRAAGRSPEYGLQLREKQRPAGSTGFWKTVQQLFQKLIVTEHNRRESADSPERRLDNVVYRLGFASSRAEARQLVTHGHFTVNGKKANIPSMLVKVNDVIQVKPKSKESPKFAELKEQVAYKTPPEWLSVDVENLTGTVLAYPTRDQIDTPVHEQLIVELYSR